MRQPKVLHPDLPAPERHRLLLLGVQLFNAGEHYAAHDAWEEVWRSTTPEPKRLLQGLIQAAAALYQIRILGRRSGPRGTLAKALRNLEPYAEPNLPAPVHLGLAVTQLVGDLEHLRAWLEQETGEVPVPILGVVDPDALR